MNNLTHPDPRGQTFHSRVLANSTPEHSQHWQATRSRLLDELHRLELLSLQFRRLAGDPYGRPVRPNLRPVAGNPAPGAEGVPHGN